MSRRIVSEQKITLTDNQKNAQTGGKLLFTVYREQPAALLVSDNRLLAAQFMPAVKSEIGAVYIARVKSVVQNLGAYFVEIGADRRVVCFLSQKDAAYPYLLNRRWDGRIKEGDLFPVQITRDAQKTKQPSVTTCISLSNDYFAFSVGETRTGFSNKLSKEQKAALKKAIKAAALTLPADIPLPAQTDYTVPAGMVVRTKAADFIEQNPPDTSGLTDAFQTLYAQWVSLFETALHRTCFSCLLPAPTMWEDALQHLASPQEYTEILTDQADIFETLQNDPAFVGKSIRYYSEAETASLPLSSLYGLSAKLDTALGKKVWLKSGAYLVIEPTEALTVIDVNSGKFASGKPSAETIRMVNREAAEEIALQLRLRNLSGIIIVDFINMDQLQDQKELLQYLSALTANDRQQTRIVGITPLGLVEITRKKNSRPLAEQYQH